jgi:hypothetical protein
LSFSFVPLYFLSSFIGITSTMSKDLIPVPTLSAQGWVYDVLPRFDYLMGHYVSSDMNQSEIYGSNVANLQGVLQKHTGDPIGTADGIQMSLLRYLSRYYDKCTVDVTHALEDE